MIEPVSHATPDIGAVFREAMTCFAGGITAITTTEGGTRWGLIATSVCSLSAEPPSVLACVNKGASAHDAILRAGSFAVNLLGQAHLAVATQFATMRGPDRFADAYWHDGAMGLPVLAEAVVAFECDLAAVHDGFSHSILIGRIVHAAMNDDAAAHGLLWHRRRYAHAAAMA